MKPLSSILFIGCFILTLAGCKKNGPDDANPYPMSIKTDLLTPNVNDPITFAIQHYGGTAVNWNFGDGTPEINTYIGEKIHSYDAPGTYTVHAKVSMDTGVVSLSGTVTVSGNSFGKLTGVSVLNYSSDLNLNDNMYPSTDPNYPPDICYKIRFQNMNMIYEVVLPKSAIAHNFISGNTPIEINPALKIHIPEVSEIMLIMINDNSVNEPAYADVEMARFVISQSQLQNLYQYSIGTLDVPSTDVQSNIRVYFQWF